MSNKIRESIVEEPFVWPGGYERFAITDDGGVLCCKCCESEAELIDNAYKGDGWNVVGEGNMGQEDDDVYCCNCNEYISGESE